MLERSRSRDMHDRETQTAEPFARGPSMVYAFCNVRCTTPGRIHSMANHALALPMVGLASAARNAHIGASARDPNGAPAIRERSR